ncbi:MAG TPA: hypothetical protein VGL81_32155 [Polyangiaceae bacterium]
MLKVVFNAWSMDADPRLDNLELAGTCGGAVVAEEAYASGMRGALAGVLLLALTCGCARPFLARDGTLVFQEKGAHGASVLTANGLEFHDVTDVPKRVVVRDPYEPWRAPLGFLVPASGRFTKTSTPTLVATPGLAIVLRPSDTRVPSWGGEMLVRVDVLAPAAPGTARWGEDVAIVLDGRGADTGALAEAALSRLGGRDRVVVVDAAGAHVVVPPMPASNRSLILAAIERRVASPPDARIDPARAVAKALEVLTRGTLRRVLVLSEAGVDARDEALRGLGDEMVPLSVVSTRGDDLDARRGYIEAFVPASGDTAFRDVVLGFEGTPAPSHVLEASGGDARWELEGGDLALGDVRAGDERAEVVRVTIPAWTAGEAFTLHVAVRFDDVARNGEHRTMKVDLPCTYDDDVVRLAESRHGDVIAYASALATLARLDATFLGGGQTPGDLRPIALMHARSLGLLARDMHDPAAAAQAALLEALLSAE